MIWGLPLRDRFPLAAKHDPWIVFLLGLVIFLPGIGSFDLWNPDEPRYAQVASEMRESGEYLVPHLNGERYGHKPPLLFWTIDLAGLVTGGIGPVAARLPSALSATGAVLVLFLLVRGAFGRRAAWLSAAIYATSAKTIWQAHFGQIDMLLGFCVLLAVASWMRAWALGASSIHYRLFFVFAGLGILAKGPVGLLPALFSIVVYLAWIRDWPSLRAFRIPTGLLFCLGVAALWFVPAVAQAGWSYAEELLFKQSVTRYMDPWHHIKPWYYYLTVLPADFFPWLFLLPAALLAAWKKLEGEARRRYFFFLSWALVTLVFFSLSSAKRTVYIFQMFPALAALTGVGLDAWIADRALLKRRWLVVPITFLAALFALLAGALAVLGPEREEVVLFGADFPYLAAGALGLLAVFFAVGVYFAAKRRPGATIFALANGMTLLAVVLFTILLPRFDVVKSARPMSEKLVEVAPPDEPWAMVPKIDPPFLFYTGRFAVNLEAGLPPAGDGFDPERLREPLADFVSQDRRFWLLAERDVIDHFSDLLDPLHPVARGSDPEDGNVLFTNDPAYAGSTIDSVEIVRP